MKRILSFIGFFILLVVNTLQAQQNEKPLMIGDFLPDAPVSMVNYPQTRVHLALFKGKPIILDFWATWCAPCVASFPKMDSLQRKYKNSLFIIPVTYEDKATVQSFMDRLNHVKKIKPISIVSDKLLNSLFPHQTVPHYVWVDKNGKVQAITYQESVTEKNIKRLIANNTLSLPVKKEITNDFVASSSHTIFSLLTPQRTLNSLLSGDSNIVYYHMMTRFIPQYGGLADWSIKNKISMTNISVLGLFQIAYGEGIKYFGAWNKIRLTTTDSSRFTENSGLKKSDPQYRELWRQMPGHLYNYLLKIPMKDSAQRWDIFRSDLRTYFPYISAKIEKENVWCWVLEKINNDTSLFASKDTGDYSMQRSPYYLIGNKVPMKQFIEVLKLAYQNNDLQIVDGTLYNGKIDLQVEAEVSNPEKLNEALLKYGLTLKKEKKLIDILVITDSEGSLGSVQKNEFMF